MHTLGIEGAEDHASCSTRTLFPTHGDLDAALGRLLEAEGWAKGCDRVERYWISSWILRAPVSSQEASELLPAGTEWSYQHGLFMSYLAGACRFMVTVIIRSFSTGQCFNGNWSKCICYKYY